MTHKKVVAEGDIMDIQKELILPGGYFKKLLEEEHVGLRQKYNMKKAELEVLYFLSHCGSQNTSTDIHRQLMMNRGHVSQAVDTLCRRRYIVAIPDKNDRRYIHYEVMDTAQEIIMEMTDKREKMHQKILEGITEEELKIYREVSIKIKKNIEKLI